MFGTENMEGITMVLLCILIIVNVISVWILYSAIKGYKNTKKQQKQIDITLEKLKAQTTKINEVISIMKDN